MNSKKRFHLFNQKGFSLVEVMVAGSLMIVAIGGTLAMTGVLVKQAAGLKESMGAIEVEKVMVKALADGTICTKQLTEPAPQSFNPILIGTSSSPSISLTEIPASSADGAPALIQQGEVLSAHLPTVVVDSIEVSDFESTGTPNVYIAIIKVNVSSTTGGREMRPLNSRMVIRTSPTASTPTNQVISSCGLGGGAGGKRGLASYDTPGNHTFTVPDEINQIYVEVVGGGGGGAGGFGSRASGGGGSGGFASGWMDVTPGQVIPLTVGTGGAGTSGSQGSNGGTTTIGSISCTGGEGATSLPTDTSGGAGGTCTGGEVNLPGGDGGDGDQFYHLSPGGHGASSRFGGGGRAGISTNGSGTSVYGNRATDAQSPGAGGGGAFGDPGGTYGGNGGPGAVFIFY